MNYRVFNESRVSPRNQAPNGCFWGSNGEAYRPTSDLDDALDFMQCEHDALGEPMRVEEIETRRVVARLPHREPARARPR